MRATLRTSLIVALSAATHVAFAQPATPRLLTNTVATSPDSLVGSITVRPLRNGRVLILEPNTGRLLVLDSSFRATTADSSATSGFLGLIGFRGDSSLALEAASNAFVVFDPDGKPTRTMAAPRSPDGRSAHVGFDQTGHLILRTGSPVFLTLLPPDFAGDTVMSGPDSLAILRVNVSTRVLDTLAFVRAPRVRQFMSRPLGGRGSGRPVVNPVAGGDDWTLLSDGVIAIVREHDYHVDWITPDGRRTSTGKLPGAWTRLSDSAKVAIVDSARRAGGGRGRGGVENRYVDPSSLPDSIPPFVAGQTRGDSEGRVWVRTRYATSPGAAVYDVIDRTGVTLDRVQLPGGATLVGFMPGHVLVTFPVSRTASRLEKIRIR